MKHLKLYEGYKNPDVGDYVMCELDINNELLSDLIYFIKNNIGLVVKIIIIHNTLSEYDKYIITYKNIPSHLLKYFGYDGEYAFKFNRDEIKHYSKDIEKLEPILAANKFNL